MTEASPVVFHAAASEHVATVRGWVTSTHTEPGTFLPPVAEIARTVQLPQSVVRSALQQLVGQAVVSLHDGFRLYTVGVMTPTDRVYRKILMHIHTQYEPGQRFMVRHDVARLFGCGVKEAGEAVKRLVAEG
ncbi:regulatory GntR family protein, partial [Streptomyces sp. KhCrAH-43]|uniref:GntR family transcriptional regulator n=2 Tax=Streptomyces TaxID=1883 RepID=UPI00048C1C5A